MEVFNPISSEEIAPATVQTATIPDGCVFANISMRGATVIMTTNGDTPDTSNTGHEFASGTTVVMTIAEDTTLKFLESGGTAAVYITYYSKQVI